MNMARKKYSSNFKALIALEAVRNEATIVALSKKYGVHSTQIQTWKTRLMATAANIFLRNNESAEKGEHHIARLEQKIGQLTVENDFLKKNLLRYPRKTD